MCRYPLLYAMWNKQPLARAPYRIATSVTHGLLWQRLRTFCACCVPRAPGAAQQLRARRCWLLAAPLLGGLYELLVQECMRHAALLLCSAAGCGMCAACAVTSCQLASQVCGAFRGR